MTPERKYQLKKLAKGLCQCCTKPRMQDHVLCEHHYNLSNARYWNKKPVSMDYLKKKLKNLRTMFKKLSLEQQKELIELLTSNGD
jgi:hypothetical protein